MGTQKIADVVIDVHLLALPEYGKELSHLGYHCHYTDLCDGVDAIALSKLLKSRGHKQHLLSEALSKYYSNVTQKTRYSQYKHDGLDYSSLPSLVKSISEKMNGLLEKFVPQFNKLERRRNCFGTTCSD